MKTKDEKGVTLVELLIVMSIIAMVVVAVALPLRSGRQVWEAGDRSAEVMQNALIAMDKMTREIGQARRIISSTAETDSVEFIDRDGNTMKFQHNNGFLEYGAPDAMDILAGPIDNLTLTCYLEDGATVPESPDDVRLVRIQLTASDSQGKASPITLSSMVSLKGDADIAPWIFDDVGDGTGGSGSAGKVLHIFGENSVELENNVAVTGNVGTNGDLTWVSNNVNITGNIFAYGSLTLKNNARVTGDITAGANGDDLTELWNNSVVTGDIMTNGNVDLKNNSTVGGTILYGGTLSASGGSSYGSATQLGSSLSEARFLTKLPGAIYGSFSEYPNSASAVDISLKNNETMTLLPGTYHDVSLKNNSQLFMSSGNYYFNSLSAVNNSKLNVNLSGGGIRIFVANGGLSLKNNHSVALTNGGAEKVYVEVLGNFEVKNNGQWRGTVFAPNGDITFGNNTNITGALYSGTMVTLENNCTFSGVIADDLPEF